MDGPLFNWMWKLPTTSCHFCSFLKLWAHLTWLREVESYLSTYSFSLASGEEPERASDGARPGLRPGPGEHQRPRHRRRQQRRRRLQLICTEVVRLQVHQLQGTFTSDVTQKDGLFGIFPPYCIRALILQHRNHIIPLNLPSFFLLGAGLLLSSIAFCKWIMGQGKNKAV